MKLLPVFGRHLDFRGEGITSVGTIENLTLDNMGITLGMLSPSGTEPGG